MSRVLFAACMTTANSSHSTCNTCYPFFNPIQAHHLPVRHEPASPSHFSRSLEWQRAISITARAVCIPFIAGIKTGCIDRGRTHAEQRGRPLMSVKPPNGLVDQFSRACSGNACRLFHCFFNGPASKARCKDIGFHQWLLREGGSVSRLILCHIIHTDAQ